MRLIDADAVEKQAYDDVHYHAELEDWEFDVVTHYLDHAPTIDAVPVVRCKDCKEYRTAMAMTYYRDGVHIRACPCERTGHLRKDDDFCSYGKQKDGDA